MSKSGKLKKYRWEDEEDFDNYSSKNNKKNSERRKEKRIKNEMRGKNLNYFYSEDEQ